MSKMPGTFEFLAIERVRGYLSNYDTNQPAEILADILHYCNNSGIDIHNQLRLAQSYVDEELSVDEPLNTKT
jgi:hypothetical protein